MEAFLEYLASVPLLLPLAIMCLRIIDVTLGTVRMVMVIRGYRLRAAVLGFFEVTVWLTAIAGIMSHIDSWVNVIFYGLGFALGNVIGLSIEKKMAIGQQVVRFISRDHDEKIIRTLRSSGYGVTEVVASGHSGPVGLGFVIISRKRVPELVRIVSDLDPHAVITIEDVRQSNAVDFYQRAGDTRRFRFVKKK
ncbi:MAG: DUF5698 domain-containing protein [Gemmatimonadota bacterium]|nr:DUF5698 domain-containing protein [Gemmatimonadota bacterium]